MWSNKSVWLAIALTACSLLIGNGYSPIFLVMCLCTFQVAVSGLSLWLILTSVWLVSTCFSEGSQLSYITFQLLMFLAGVSPLFICNLVVRTKVTLVSPVVLPVLHWFISNSICFFQMSGLIKGWEYYSFDLNGYYTCLVSGGRFLLHSLIVTVFFYPIVFTLKWFDVEKSSITQGVLRCN